jgi:CBS domain-containing protein
MKALDLMTYNAITVQADDSIVSAIRLMLDNNVSGLPVVDGSHNLVGIVTESDLMRRAELATGKRRSWWYELLTEPGKQASDYAHTHAQRVRDVMIFPVKTIEFDTPVDAAVDLFERHGVRRLPVVRGATVVGILSRKDLLRAAYWLIAEPLAAVQSPIPDRDIVENINRELRKQKWAQHNCVQTRVQGGAVKLCGVIFDERERSALRVLAEGVPGVTSVEDHLVYAEPNSGFVFAPSVISPPKT